jgi:hypothetical protein
MKTLQRLCVATVLTLVLTTATLAGEINTPGVAQPSPTPAPALAMAACEIPICESTSTSDVDLSASDSLTDFALDLLQIMLTVF